jgi:adenylate cyclase class 2
MKHEEIEVKFLEIDSQELQKKLEDIGAVRVGEYFQRVHIFDFPGFPLDSANSWVRLRDNGEKKTLSFKRRIGVVSVDGKKNDETAEEIEITVDDIEKTRSILYAIGMIDKRYMENKRIRWKKGSVVFDLDFWPRVPPYVEIEGESIEEVQKASIELGFDFNQGKIYSAQQAFLHYGIDPNDYTTMTFEKFIRKDGILDIV